MQVNCPKLVDPNTPPFIAPFLIKDELLTFRLAFVEPSILITPPFPNAKFSSKYESVNDI